MSWAFRCFRVALTVAVLSGLGLSGCSAGQPQSADPSESLVLPEPVGSVARWMSTASSPSPSALLSASTVAPAPVPAVAHERTVRGAEAFVRHFVAEYNRAMVTPAAGLLGPLSQSSCGTCDGLEEDVESLLKDGVRYAAPPADIKLLDTYFDGNPGEPDRYDFVFRVNRPRVNVIDRAGTVDETLPVESSRLSFNAVWTDAGWRMASIKVVR